MASLLKNYMWFPVLLAIFYTIYWNNTYKKMFKKIFNGDIIGAYELYQKNDDNIVNTDIKLFTKNELIKYQNLDNGLYLGLIGQVFDVTSGNEHYGPGGSYHAFTGKDASMAFVTGNFEPDGLTDDTSELTNSQAKSMNDWIKFYHDKYIFKGKLIGTYYDENGNPTSKLVEFLKKVDKANEELAADDNEKKMFPPCNIEWKPEEGTQVWCTKMSGGIHRDWLGIPMQYFDDPSNLQNRCACVNIESKEYKLNKARFRRYDECLEDSSICFLKT